ncbi:MerR family transcriptional regulator [Paenibacillus sp. GCM10012303]|uniref:MerR family transcriptional regulator n=1 Tax=Paenibacillus sp. GCM10012303 TaxID=3317340 RepID=UPI00361DCA96
MLYTVKEVSSLTNVTVKALHHYHKLGLLVPCEISGAGYRLYGVRELERLQHILLYRELDFTLEQIGQLLDGNPDRPSILAQQEELLVLRKRRLETIIQTLRTTIACAQKGEQMEMKEMFKGFESDEAWKEAMQEQNEHLKETYGYDMLDSVEVDAQSMNAMAEEAAAFMTGVAEALRNGVKCKDDAILRLIREHLDFLNKQGVSVTAEEFASQTRFFLQDDFHLQMLEGQQVGLAYYLSAAAECYAAEERK